MDCNKKPNILWICTDSQRWDTLGCYGNKWVKTPNIDRLASEGMLFERAYCQNPLCTPSRGSFLTGRYPTTTKLRQNGQDIPESEVLVTRVLNDNGYVCGLSGKLHLSACDHKIKNFGRDPANWWKQTEEYHFKGIERRINDGYSEFHWCHGMTPSNSYRRWLQEKGRKPEKLQIRADSKHVYHGVPDEFHVTTFCVEKAMGFIEAYADYHCPWLFSVNIWAPHLTLAPVDEYMERYLDMVDEIPDADFFEGELGTKPPYQAIYQKNIAHNFDWNTMTARERKFCKAAYWAAVDHIDYQIGRLLDCLEATGQKENTMVIFTSDHGELIGDHGLYIKGPFLYEGAVRVPLIISYPGVIPAGTRRSALVELADLAPTVLDCAGLPREPGMQARSLWNFLTDAKAEDFFREDVYCEYMNSNPDTLAQFCTMVRGERYKIVVFHGQKLGELYDLNTDPAELNNLWDSPGHAEAKIEMLKRVCDRLAQNADPLPERIGIF
ncbi:MAG: sulfatase-like hydrolase/transferase [Defluviitaleaceae bacterium]|nr:sulfatase-like hydrolase/transferase [Defluviitaleaceae bacterium]